MSEMTKINELVDMEINTSCEIHGSVRVRRVPNGLMYEYGGQDGKVVTAIFVKL